MQAVWNKIQAHYRLWPVRFQRISAVFSVQCGNQGLPEIIHNSSCPLSSSFSRDEYPYPLSYSLYISPLFLSIMLFIYSKLPLDRFTEDNLTYFKGASLAITIFENSGFSHDPSTSSHPRL